MRYVADGTPGTWYARRSVFVPDVFPVPTFFRIVVGPDYVGEWKAMNGK